MKTFEISKDDLGDITLFLIEKKVILHPKISPEGTPDFTGHRGKNYVLILDRNLVVILLKLISDGTLKDKFSLRLISSLMSWVEINNVSINAGVALMEYSHHHRRNDDASAENNLFKKIFDTYDPDIWFGLALGHINKIPPITLDKSKSVDYNFFVEDDHFKMHYLEMLKITQLHFNADFDMLSKFNSLHNWIFDNILISDYTHYFAALIFGRRSKVFKGQIPSFEETIKTCKNQAWDMTYLSIRSIYYYKEPWSEVHLFATNDKELKQVFFLAQSKSFEIYHSVFGTKLGGEIVSSMNEIYTRKRVKPKIDSNRLDQLIITEKDRLKQTLFK